MDKKKLFYYTTAFPFGAGEMWKSNELEVLSKEFDVTVIPLHYAQNKIPVAVPANVKVETPLMEHESFQVKIAQLPKLFMHPSGASFFWEFIRKRPFLNKEHLISFFIELKRVHYLWEHKACREYLNQPGIHYFFWGRGTSALIPFIKKRADQKIAVRLHGFDLYEEREHGYIPFRDNMLKMCDLILLISEFGKKYLSEKYPFALPKMMVNRLGVKFKSKRTSNDDGVFKVLSCATLIPLKRMDLLAEAICKMDIKIKWKHLGDGEERQKIESILKKAPENVEYEISGWLPAKQILDEIIGYSPDIFVNVSTTEGLPVSIMEAYSCGVPAYATHVGGTHEIVNESNGKLLDPTIDAEQLASELEDFSKLDNQKKNEMSENAFKTFQELYDAQDNSSKLAAKFNSLFS